MLWISGVLLVLNAVFLYINLLKAFAEQNPGAKKYLFFLSSLNFAAVVTLLLSLYRLTAA